MATVREQVTKNGGSSLLDAVNRIEEKVTDLLATNEVLQQISSKPLFKTDKDGNCIWVNSAYSEAVGKTLDDLKGHGWAGIISDEDKSRVSSSWKLAILDHRRFDDIFTVINDVKDKKITVRCRAYPIMVKERLLGYLGGWVILSIKDASES